MKNHPPRNNTHLVTNIVSCHTKSKILVEIKHFKYLIFDFVCDKIKYLATEFEFYNKKVKKLNVKI